MPSKPPRKHGPRITPKEFYENPMSYAEVTFPSVS